MTVPGLRGILTKEDLSKLKAISNSYMYKNICTVVCKELDVRVSDIEKGGKKGNIALARMLISYYLVTYGDLKLKEVGYLLRPNKPLDHTTIMYHRQTILNSLDISNKGEYAENVREFVKEIDSKLKQLCM